MLLDVRHGAVHHPDLRAGVRHGGGSLLHHPREHRGHLDHEEDGEGDPDEQRGELALVVDEELVGNLEDSEHGRRDVCRSCAEALRAFPADVRDDKGARGRTACTAHSERRSRWRPFCFFLRHEQGKQEGRHGGFPGQEGSGRPGGIPRTRRRPPARRTRHRRRAGRTPRKSSSRSRGRSRGPRPVRSRGRLAPSRVP